MSRKKKPPSRFRLVLNVIASSVLALGCLVALGVFGSKVIVPPSWEKTTGHLTSVERDPGDSRTVTTYDRTYSFEVDGRTYSAESSRYSHGDIGSPAPIRYDPTDPTRAAVVGFWDRFVGILKCLAVLLLLLGTSLSVVGNVDALRKKKPT